MPRLSVPSHPLPPVGGYEPSPIDPNWDRHYILDETGQPVRVYDFGTHARWMSWEGKGLPDQRRVAGVRRYRLDLFRPRRCQTTQRRSVHRYEEVRPTTRQADPLRLKDHHPGVGCTVRHSHANIASSRAYPSRFLSRSPPRAGYFFGRDGAVIASEFGRTMVHAGGGDGTFRR